MSETLEPADSSDVEGPGRGAVADNYEGYLSDAYGYAYGARDVVSLRILDAHDELAADPEAGLEGRNVDDLDDFERFGLARGLADTGAMDRFAEVVSELIGSERDHEGLRYPEIPVYAARVAVEHGAVDRADEWLGRGIERWPDQARPAHLLRARIALRHGEPERADSIYEQLVERNPDDPELAFEIAEDLAAEDDPGRALDWIERARAIADRVGDAAIRVDLEVLESRVSGDGTNSPGSTAE